MKMSNGLKNLFLFTLFLQHSFTNLKNGFKQINQNNIKGISKIRDLYHNQKRTKIYYNKLMNYFKVYWKQFQII